LDKTDRDVSNQEENFEAGAATYSVSLPTGGFEGPLDLLLHLCQKHELDILDIPIAFVTEKYLEYLAVMQLAHLDVAAEYLVMAATLAHIKSKMLLPAPPPGQEDELGEEGEDPRAALIRRLLEYQKYKHAAGELTSRGVSGQDVFMRGAPMAEAAVVGEPPLAEVPLFRLLEAFQSVLAKSKVKITHDIVADRISITDRIHELTDVLRVKRRAVFEELFHGLSTKFDIVITFLALLEMSRLKMSRLYQVDPFSPLYVELADAMGAEAMGTDGGEFHNVDEADAETTDEHVALSDETSAESTRAETLDLDRDPGTLPNDEEDTQIDRVLPDGFFGPDGDTMGDAEAPPSAPPADPADPVDPQEKDST
jgi:segregation and condensation protein A